MEGTALVSEIISILTSGISGIATGVGAGLSTLASSIFFATGEGANGRTAMGISVVGGMLISTLLTMFIVPAIYTYISTNRINKKKE